MPQLNLILPDMNKGQSEFNKQVFVAIQDIQNWANSSTNRKLVETNQTINTNTTDTNYNDIPGMSVTFQNSGSSNAQILYNLSLSGDGSIGLYVNGLLVKEKSFNHNASINNLCFVTIESLKAGNNIISLKWKAVTGTVTIASFNSIQVLSYNS